MKTISKCHVIHTARYDAIENTVEFFEGSIHQEFPGRFAYYDCFVHSSEGGVTVMRQPDDFSVSRPVEVAFRDNTTPLQAVILVHNMLCMKDVAQDDLTDNEIGAVVGDAY